MVRWYLLGALGASLIVGSLFLLVHILTPPPAPEATPVPPALEQKNAPAAAQSESRIISVPEQSAGSRFYVSGIRVDRASWLVIYPPSGEPQEPLGALFFPGISEL